MYARLPRPRPPSYPPPRVPPAPPRPSVPHNGINVGSGSEIISTKRQSQSLIAGARERTRTLELALEHARAFELALELAYPHLSRMQGARALLQEARELTHKRALALTQEVQMPLLMRIQALPLNRHFSTTEVLADSDPIHHLTRPSL